MATFSNPSDGFYDRASDRSPRAMRSHHSIRHSARPMDGYNTMQGSMFGNGAGGPSMRFDGMRENFGPPMQNGASAHFPYDAGAAQTWNASNMPYGNGMGGMSQDNGYGPARSVKPSRGRSNISNVSEQPSLLSNTVSVNRSCSCGITLLRIRARCSLPCRLSAELDRCLSLVELRCNRTMTS